VPQLNLRLGSKLRHSNIAEDMDVYFECNIRANPWVSETGWRFEGQDLQSNVSAGIVLSNQSLVLQKVSRSQRGRYSCTATNNEGMGESNHVYLRVQYAPICKSDQEMSFTTVINRPVQIHCDVEADTEELNFRWEFNGTSAGGDLQVMPVPGATTKSIVNYIPRTEADFGIVHCWATNNVGTQNPPCAFLIIPAEPPQPVHNCTVTEESSDFFRVLCNSSTPEPEDELLELLQEYFYVEIRDRDSGELLQNYSVNFPEVLVRGLDPGTWYSVVVYVRNEAGRSAPTVLEVKTFSEDEKVKEDGKGWNLESSPLIFITGAGAGGLLLVVLMICCALRFRLSRRKNKDSLSSQGNEKSTHNSEKSGDSCSEGCTCSREDEKIRENIPDVVVFSEKAKTEEADRLKYTSSTSYWNTMTLPTDQEMSTQAKIKSVDPTPPWTTTTDWVIPSQPVEMVTLQGDDAGVHCVDIPAPSGFGGEANGRMTVIIKTICISKYGMMMQQQHCLDS
ncbi:hypothetical protein JTE90_008115, partial [Oedothorax gibbosus]